MTKARDLANGGFGLVLIKPSSVVNGTDNGKGTVSFSAQSSVSLNGVFTSTYENYRIVLSNLNGSGSTAGVQFRLRKSGSDNSSNIYWRQDVNAAATAVNANRAQSTSWVVAAVRDQGPFNSVFDLTSPNQASIKTGLLCLFSFNSASEIQGRFLAGTHDLASSADFDGFSLIPESGTMTGNISVYGYNK